MFPRLPNVFREEDALRLIVAHLDAGERDPALIACNTATTLFANRRCPVFPPPLTAPVEVRTAWDRLLAHVDRAFAERGIAPGDPTPATDAVAWRIVSTSEGSPDLASYPFEAPSLHESGVPAPSTFWLAGGDDYTLVRDYVASCLQIAGVDPSPAAEDSRLGRRLRHDAREIIVACAFNDRRVTSRSATLAGGRDPQTNGPEDPGVTHVLGEHGRGLCWAHRHYDDLTRMSAGLAPKRGVDLYGAAIGSGRSAMLLYLPAVQPEALRGGEPTITLDGMRWSDGSSAGEPPPDVAKLGVDTSGVMP